MRKTVRSYPRCVGPSSSGTSAAGVRNDPTSTRQDWCSAPTTGAAVAPSSSTESWPPANSVSSAWSRFPARRSPTPVTSKQHNSHTVGCPSPSSPVSVQPIYPPSTLQVPVVIRSRQEIGRYASASTWWSTLPVIFKNSRLSLAANIKYLRNSALQDAEAVLGYNIERAMLIDRSKLHQRPASLLRQFPSSVNLPPPSASLLRQLPSSVRILQQFKSRFASGFCRYMSRESQVLEIPVLLSHGVYSPTSDWEDIGHERSKYACLCFSHSAAFLHTHLLSLPYTNLSEVTPNFFTTSQDVSPSFTFLKCAGTHIFDPTRPGRFHLAPLLNPCWAQRFFGSITYSDFVTLLALVKSDAKMACP
ncbi:hypothetical protein CF326_g2788 [Tilletia indica]|nr:hypothetical protein CF326_g2788 [Tilletia indica]